MAETREEQVLSVSDLTAYLRHLLESDPRLQGVQVLGEVSNLVYHGSGHVYFTLKDDGAQISCAWFRNYQQGAPRLKAGDEIVVWGEISLYPPRGQYQFLVKRVRKLGTGDLFQQFQELKDKLQKEGLFDLSIKKKLPALALKLGVITSPTGAALRDVLRTIYRRFPRVKVLILPAKVQGEGAGASIVSALLAAEKQQLDLVLLVRGGGSIEDLWAFNEEKVARAIYACTLPVVSGVGHETDFTIADFVADYRASTPTAAAEAVTPDRQHLLRQLAGMEASLARGLRYFLQFQRQIVDDYSDRLRIYLRQHVSRSTQELDLLANRLDSLNPAARFEQGFTLTLKEGKVVRSSEELTPGDTIETIFPDGVAISRVLPSSNE